MPRRRRQLRVRDPQILLLLPLPACPHRHAPILQTHPVHPRKLSARESALAPRAVRRSAPASPIGGERASTTRMRLSEQIAAPARHRSILSPTRSRENGTASDVRRDTVSLMHFILAKEGWSVTFLEEDLKTSLPRRFVFQNDVKILDLARRGGAEFNLAGRQAIEQGISMGRGAVWLSLTREQYAKLRG
jgi:hypothetical protein